MTHLSVSQYNTYTQCPYAYFLERREKAWQKPAAWFPMGSAVHTAAQKFEESRRTLTLEETQDVFRDAYTSQINEMLEDCPNTDLWSASGRYQGEEDIRRRYDIGLEHVERYVQYYRGKGKDEVIWITPDGTPAIELGFEIDLDGVTIKGFIDQMVMVKPDLKKPESRSKAAVAKYENLLTTLEPKPMPRDIKSGRKPGPPIQLGTYDVAMEVQYGHKADRGDFWMSRTGGPTKRYDLTEWTRERVTEEYHWLAQEIKAEHFDPRPDPNTCRTCSVQHACPFFLP